MELEGAGPVDLFASAGALATAACVSGFLSVEEQPEAVKKRTRRPKPNFVNLLIALPPGCDFLKVHINPRTDFIIHFCAEKLRGCWPMPIQGLFQDRLQVNFNYG
ncbi:MAG TPA: hypothetical protein VF452_09645 [Candidatus Binatia bacterium]